MTRINVVDPQELCNKHLFAEWRELPRVFSSLEKSLKRSTPFCETEIPYKYKMGKGHVKFFYNKLTYLLKRHDKITEELIERGYNITYPTLNIFAPKKYYNDWKPTKKDKEINRQRIKKRMPKNPKWSLK